MVMDEMNKYHRQVGGVRKKGRCIYHMSKLFVRGTALARLGHINEEAGTYTASDGFTGRTTWGMPTERLGYIAPLKKVRADL